MNNLNKKKANQKGDNGISKKQKLDNATDGTMNINSFFKNKNYVVSSGLANMGTKQNKPDKKSIPKNVEGSSYQIPITKRLNVSEVM